METGLSTFYICPSVGLICVYSWNYIVYLGIGHDMGATLIYFHRHHLDFYTEFD